MAGQGRTRGIATDLATLDTAYFLSEILVTLCVGFIVDSTGSTIYYIIVAAASSAIGCYLSSRIICSKADMSPFVRHAVLHDENSNPTTILFKWIDSYIFLIFFGHRLCLK